MKQNNGNNDKGGDGSGMYNSHRSEEWVDINTHLKRIQTLIGDCKEAYSMSQ